MTPFESIVANCMFVSPPLPARAPHHFAAFKKSCR